MNAVRLRHVVRVNPSSRQFDRLPDDAELSFLPMEAVWPGKKPDRSQRRRKASVASGYTRFEDGDVLVPKITPTFEASRSILIDGLLNGVGAGTTELHVLRPSNSIDPRYLLYITYSHPFLKLGQAEMYGVAGQKRVPDAFIRDYRVDLPPLPIQRRIADFLDTAVSRVNDLMLRRTVQRALLMGRRKSALSSLFASKKFVETRLKYLLAARPRYGVLVPEFVQDGVPMVRINDLVDLPGRMEKIPQISSDLSQAYPRTVLSQGDLLVSVVGTLGRAALVPPELAGANVNRPIAVLKPRPEVDRSALLAWLSGPDFERQALDVTGSDSAQRTLGMEDLANFRLSWPTRHDQVRQLSAACGQIEAEHQMLDRCLDRQQKLLAERRRALITAAVTGRLHVTTARGVRN